MHSGKEYNISIALMKAVFSLVVVCCHFLITDCLNY